MAISKITGSGLGTIVGNVDFNGDMDVDGTANLDIVDIDGAVNMATTALVTGVLTANGGAVFNEGSADVDFRVEGNGNANALFVEGETDQVGIGTNDPARPLSVFHATAPYVQVANNTSGIAAGDGFQLQLVAADLYQWNYENGFQRFGTNNATSMNISAAGEITKPRQPAVQAQVNGTQSNIAAGSLYTIPFATEIFDQGGNFASNTFTAPVTGKYALSVTATLGGLPLAAEYVQYHIATSNRNYNVTLDPDGLDSSPVFWGFNINVLMDMDASDTCIVKLLIEGSVDTLDVFPQTYLSIHLAC